MKNPIFYPMWQRVLIYLQEKGTENVHRMSLEMVVTYSALIGTIKQMQRENFIKMERRGRCWKVTLTRKGSSLAEALRATTKDV